MTCFDYDYWRCEDVPSKMCMPEMELTSYCENSIESVGYVVVKVKIEDNMMALKLEVVIAQ